MEDGAVRCARLDPVDVGILGGTGPAGQALALRLSAAGMSVVVGSRDAERAQSLVDELLSAWSHRKLALQGADNSSAAAADLVVLATPWDAAVPTVTDLLATLEGKVVVSMANALTKVGREMQAIFASRGSIAQSVAAAAPACAVAAAFHHLPARSLAKIDSPFEADVLVCADQKRALSATCELIERVPGLRPVQAGSLAAAAPLEAFTAVLINISVRYKTHASVAITGMPTEGRL
jgi:8-hydroxy-5-deazaflavin:NADPH oxidoreductase